jgi:hypothetical protein
MSVGASRRCMNMEAAIDENACMEIVGDYNPPDSGFNYLKLHIEPHKPSFFKERSRDYFPIS